jgi:hypothetical protein
MLARFLLGAALASGLSVAAVAQDAGPCVILSVSGDAVVSAPGAGRQTAVPGLGIGRNATLRTGPEARVTLQCPDALQVIVGPDTDIGVARIVPGGRQPVALRLMRGIAGFLFDGTGDGVQVNTPSAVAAVRSTQWAMRVVDGATGTFAREGTVSVHGAEAAVRLTPGEGVDVTADGEVRPVVRWGQPRIDLFAQLLGPDW